MIESVYRVQVAPVYGFFSYSVERDVAEALTATTFERVVRSWRRSDRARSSERTWVFSIARNVLIDHLRRSSHRAGRSAKEHPEMLAALVSSDDPVTQAMSTEALKAWFQGLRPPEREVLALRYGADLSVAEIAEIMDVSKANIHQISSGALRRLPTSVAADQRGEGAIAEPTTAPAADPGRPHRFPRLNDSARQVA